ncbi:hypothetical protein [Krasilnikovia cinnamomea]|uniref:hypothetical protein n=1 Tax=Krasilnikovia cinnamomea TaxID=349313 RepID=UPI00102CF75B|nr:hypothetical protein [Krasilnikovia cinnamomea]
MPDAAPDTTVEGGAGRPSRRWIIVTINRRGGFVSSIFLSLTGYLVAACGWRHTLVVLAAVHGCLTVRCTGC